jgi:hypothetical protein
MEQLTEKPEVVLHSVQLVERDVGLDLYAKLACPVVGVVSRNDHKTFASRLPCKINDGI